MDELSFQEQTLFLLGRLDSKVEALLSNQADLENRVQGLESFKSYILGIAAVVGSVTTLVWEWIKNGR